MEIIIRGDPEEIAALVSVVQERRVSGKEMCAETVSALFSTYVQNITRQICEAMNDTA